MIPTQSSVNAGELTPQSRLAVLRNDLPAGLVVFLVALPLCLGIALASGVPLMSGLIAGVIGGLVVGPLSGSQLSVSGPAAGLVAIMLSGAAALGGLPPLFLAVAVAGVMQLAFGFLRAGSVSAIFPSTVIKGMLAGIGMILIIKQLPVALGIESFNHLFQHISNANGAVPWSQFLDHLNMRGAIIVSTVSLIILVLWELPLIKNNRVLRLLPGALIVVLWGIAYQIAVFHTIPPLALNPEQMVMLPKIDSLGDLFKQIQLPDFSRLTDLGVYKLAFTIAIVASLETLLSLEATDRLDPYKRVAPSNRELKAQGIANMLAGLLGALPITAVIVRSSTNINAGARTKVSAIVHGVLLLISILLLADMLRWIPLSALASILLYTGYKLAKPSLFIEQKRLGWNQFLPFILTIVAILVEDLLIGIAIGMAVGIFFIIRADYQSGVTLTVQDGKHYLLRLNREASFFVKPRLRKYLEQIKHGSYVVIDVSRCRFIDHDIGEAILDFLRSAPQTGVHVELAGATREELEARSNGAGH